MEEATGKIIYISPLIDETTRTATARVVLPNPKGIWKPGLFVNGLIITDEFNAKVAVPKTAIEPKSRPAIISPAIVTVVSRITHQVRFSPALGLC